MIVIDSSVALQWVLPEPGAGQAERYLNEPNIIAPDVLFVESANVLAKKVRAGDLTPTEARQALDILTSVFSRVESTLRIVPRALEISIALSHPVYDCLFLACAEQLGASLATRDAPFAKRVRERGLGNLLVQGT